MNKPSVKFKSLTTRFGKQVIVISLGLFALSTACKKKDDDNIQVTPVPEAPVSTAPSSQDTAFVRKASLSNNAEVQLGQVALSNSQNPAVRSFGQMMINEHSVAQGELATLANNKKITFSTALDPAHVAIKNMLLAKTGADFDSMYLNRQVIDHQVTKADLQLEIAAGKDQDIKNFASKILPKVNMHLEHALKIRDSIF